MLTVIGLIAIVMAFLVPALTGAKSGDLVKSSYDISGALEQARTYAMANNTYVFFGIAEVDGAIGSTGNKTGSGRIVVSVVASRDGNKHFVTTTAAQGADWQAGYGSSGSAEGNGKHLTQISNLLSFNNVHLASTLGTVPPTGGMARPVVENSSGWYQVGDSRCLSETPFTYPLGRALSSGYQYRFDKVIQFDPQGSARITYATNSDYIPKWMELCLQQTRGNVLPGIPQNANTANNVAIQVEGMTGAIRLFRP